MHTYAQCVGGLRAVEYSPSEEHKICITISILPQLRRSFHFGRAITGFNPISINVWNTFTQIAIRSHILSCLFRLNFKCHKNAMINDEWNASQSPLFSFFFFFFFKSFNDAQWKRTVDCFHLRPRRVPTDCVSFHFSLSRLAVARCPRKKQKTNWSVLSILEVIHEFNVAKRQFEHLIIASRVKCLRRSFLFFLAFACTNHLGRVFDSAHLNQHKT